MCGCVGAVIPFILNVRLVYAPAGVTQEEGYTRFLHLPSAVLALLFIARRIQPSLSLVDREVEFCVPTSQPIFTFWAYFFCFVLFCFVKKNPSSVQLVTVEGTLIVCMYVCIVITYSRVWINRVRLPILLVVT